MSGRAEPRVVFTPSGLSGTVPPDTTVLDAARRLGVDLDSVCGGRGICGRCQIRPTIGAFAKWSITATEAALSPAGLLETDYRGKRLVADGNRLGCGARVLDDVVIDVPPDSQIHRQVVRKHVDVGDLALDPLFTLHYLELPELDDTDGSTASDQICKQLLDDWGRPDMTVAPELLGDLHRLVAGRRLTVCCRDSLIVAAWPGFVDRIVGMAVDVGSTTVAGHLCDLTTGEILGTAGRMNPQIRFGEDLMSRVSYVMMNDDGAAALTSAIRGALDELTTELLAEVAGVDRSHLLDVVIVGNPIMHHLLLGIDPTPLGQAPFTLATADPIDLAASAIGIEASSARAHIAPCIAGHVGADTAAAILSEGPHRSVANQLLVDIGTNAEIVLGNRYRLLAASSPTGPAFEGAQISGGQRATPGAIERVRIDRVTLEPRFKLIGVEPWSDDVGFENAAAATGVTGICGSGIIEVISELFLSRVIDRQGVIAADGASRSSRIRPDGRTFSYSLTERIRITQADVRAIQLAKAALRAGIELLLEHAELTEVDDVRLAGAFGAHIDPIHAMVLGLIPDCTPGNVRSVGNAAGSGAVRALLSASERAEMARAVASVTKIETATEPRFQEHFVAALAFPHQSAPNPHLAGVVDLPPIPTQAGPGTDRRRRRRAAASATNRGHRDERSR